MTEMYYKSFSLDGGVKTDDEKGIVSALVANTGVVDKQREIIEAGAIGDQSTAVWGYEHQRVPFGHAKIFEKSGGVFADAQYYLNTQRGRDEFQSVKNLTQNKTCEWSIGYLRLKTTPDIVDGKSVTRLNKIHIVHISPVWTGAQEGTRTLSIKSDAAEAPALDEKIEEALEHVDAAVEEEGSDVMTEERIIEIFNKLFAENEDARKRKEALRIIQAYVAGTSSITPYLFDIREGENNG